MQEIPCPAPLADSNTESPLPRGLVLREAIFQFPYSIATTTITCEKVFLPNLMSTRWKEHNVKRPLNVKIPFYLLGIFTWSFSLSQPSCDFSHLNSSGGGEGYKGCRTLSHPAHHTGRLPNGPLKQPLCVC